MKKLMVLTVIITFLAFSSLANSSIHQLPNHQGLQHQKGINHKRSMHHRHGKHHRHVTHHGHGMHRNQSAIKQHHGGDIKNKMPQ